MTTSRDDGRGHWRRGRSRNLDPAQLAVARTLTELLRRAIEQGWRHPTMGPLSYRIVAAALKVDPKTVSKWCKAENRPPEWALGELRTLLRDFRP